MSTVITQAGRGIISNRLKGSGTEPVYGAWGTGAGTAATTDTTLFSESADESRVSGTSSVVTTTTTNDTYRVVWTMIAAVAGKTITNAGLLDAATAGNLFLHGDFTGIALNVGDGIQ
jgi:hypothetical protein